MLSVISEGLRKERTLLSRVEPAYPPTLRQMSIGGTVRLQLTIAASGKVEKVVLLGGDPILGESAMDPAMQWIYSAAPTRTEIEVLIPFDLDH